MDEYLVHVLQGSVGGLRVEKVYDRAKREAEDAKHLEKVRNVD